MTRRLCAFYLAWYTLLAGSNLFILARIWTLGLAPASSPWSAVLGFGPLCAIVGWALLLAARSPRWVLWIASGYYLLLVGLDLGLRSSSRSALAVGSVMLAGTISCVVVLARDRWKRRAPTQAQSL